MAGLVRKLYLPLDYQEAVIRAAITLKLCAYEETGAIVAAMTTSVPEFKESGRNWDYRYCWIRDAYYTVRALNRLGAVDILENYLAICATSSTPRPAAMSSRSMAWGWSRASARASSIRSRAIAA